jgi:histidinol phosphatase-like PHP family hydrolase
VAALFNVLISCGQMIFTPIIDAHSGISFSASNQKAIETAYCHPRPGTDICCASKKLGIRISIDARSHYLNNAKIKRLE